MQARIHDHAIDDADAIGQNATNDYDENPLTGLPLDAVSGPWTARSRAEHRMAGAAW